MLRPDVLFTSSTTKDVDDDNRRRLQQYCGEVVVFEPQSAEHTSDEFLRIEAYHMNRAAKRIIDAVNDMVRQYGSEAVLRKLEEKQDA